MKYIFLQTFVTFLGAMFLLFLFQQEHFLPFDESQEFDWYNIFTVLFFLFLIIQGVISLILYLFQKFLTCGIKEFPSYNYSLKWGILVSILFILVILLNIYNIMGLTWGLLAIVLIIFLLILIKF